MRTGINQISRFLELRNTDDGFNSDIRYIWGRELGGMKQTDLPIQKHENCVQNNVDFKVSNFPGKLVQKSVCDKNPDCPF